MFIPVSSTENAGQRSDAVTYTYCGVPLAGHGCLLYNCGSMEQSAAYKASGTIYRMAVTKGKDG